MSGWIKTIVGVVVVAAIGVIVLLQVAGRGFDTDLGQLGQGKPALVLAVESYSPGGMEAMDRLNQVRDDYEDRLLFLAVNVGEPDREAFVERHGLSDGIVVFFDGDGEVLNRYRVPGDEAELRQRLDQNLEAAGRQSG